MDLQHIEDALVEAAERQRATGVKIIAHDFSKKNAAGEVACMCPVTCLTGNPACTLSEFMAVLGIDRVANLWDIIMGIDGSSNSVIDTGSYEYYKLGQRVAKRLDLK